MRISEDRGVVYLFCGATFAERVVVSLWTLRKHWQAPVSVIATDDDCQDILQPAAAELDLQLIRVEPMKARRHSAYLNKTLIPIWTPYQRTVFIDGDTTVVGNFDKLFCPGLCFTSYSDWQTQGGKISGRLKRWRGRSRLIDAALDWQLADSIPALNTGIFAFHRGNPELRLWHEVTLAGKNLHMTDELAAQLVHSHLDGCEIYDDRYNCSPIYGVHKDDVRIWHFHGRKHLRREVGKALWWPTFMAAREANVGKLAEWAGKYDKEVRQELAA